MSAADHAAIVRKFLAGRTRDRDLDAACAALDALVAERDEALEAKRGWCRLYSQDITAARAREAERDEARELSQALRVELDNEWKKRVAAKARVAELEQALREIHRDAFRYGQWWSQEKARAALGGTP